MAATQHDNTANSFSGEPHNQRISYQVLVLTVPLVLVLTSGAVLVYSTSLGYWANLGPGPGFFPFWTSVVLGTSALIWFIQTWRKLPPRGQGRASAPAHPISGSRSRGDKREFNAKNSLWIVLLSLVVLASVLELIGFQLSMFAFLLFHIKVLGDRGWWLSLLISSGGSFGVFVLFTEVLQVTLPVAGIELLRGWGL